MAFAALLGVQKDALTFPLLRWGLQAENIVVDLPLLLEGATDKCGSLRLRLAFAPWRKSSMRAKIALTQDDTRAQDTAQNNVTMSEAISVGTCKTV